MNSHADTELTEVDVETAAEMWDRKFSVYKNGELIPYISRTDYDERSKVFDEYFHESPPDGYKVLPTELQQHRELDLLVENCDKLNNLISNDDSYSGFSGYGIAEYYNIETYVKELNEDFLDQIDDEVFTEFDWSTTTNEWQNFERSILKEKTDYIKAWLNDLTDENYTLKSKKLGEMIGIISELLNEYEAKYFSKFSEREQAQELSEPNVPSEEKAEEIPAPENPDVIKDMGIEDSRIAFTEVTFDDNASFITVGTLDENAVGEMEQLLDYALENNSEEIDVRTERYSVGGANVEPKDATPEQVSYIQSHRDEVISRAVSVDTQRFKVEVDRESVAARKAEILESSSRNQDKFISSLESSEKLLPFLNANRDFHSSRLKTLNQKNATRTDKIERNEAKIERLTAKTEKLQAANEMLSSLFGGKAAPIKALIERNNARIEKIKTVKIPKREKKINKQLGKIDRANLKIEREQCAVDKLENLSKAIGSFGILNGQERRQQFAQAMDGLRDASMRSIQFKIEKCDKKLDALSEKYQTASIADRLDIAEKLKNQISRKNGFKDKLTVLEARESAFKPFEQQSAEVVDKVCETAKDACESYENALGSGADTPSIENFSEDLSVSVCERAAEIESERVQAEVEKSIKPDTFLDEGEKPAAKETQVAKKEKQPRGKRPDIIGSVKYSEIEDKVYLKMSADEARNKAEQLKGSGVRFSGRIYEDGKATLTVEKADVPKLREITERKPSVLGEIGKIQAEQKNAPKKETPAKNRQEEL